MKRTLAFILGALGFHLATAQFVAKMQLKEPICPVSLEDITKKLSRQVTYFKDSLMYEDSGIPDTWKLDTREIKQEKC
jgi:hypothetical protein